jgi:hypothetical protein
MSADGIFQFPEDKIGRIFSNIGAIAFYFFPELFYPVFK